MTQLAPASRTRQLRAHDINDRRGCNGPGRLGNRDLAWTGAGDSELAVAGTMGGSKLALECMVTLCPAGPEAEREFCGPINDGSDRVDYEMAREYLARRVLLPNSPATVTPRNDWFVRLGHITAFTYSPMPCYGTAP
jgi:hypothetical protein